MTAPTPVLRAVPFKPIRDAIQNALAANGTIAGLIGADIYRNTDVTNNAPAYIAITLLTYVPSNRYTSTQGTAHLQITCVSPGSPDDADSLSAAVATVMLDTGFAIPGYDVLDVRQAPKPPDRTPLDQSKVIWEERERYEIVIRKQQ